MSTDPLIGYSHLHATGVRTFNLLIAYSQGANHAVDEISKRVTLTVIKSNIDQEDAQAMTNFREIVLPSLLSHPHTASAYIIGTGEEPTPLHKIIGELLAINTATEYISINNGSDEAMAVTIATSGATDLNTQSLPGLREIDTPEVVLGYKTEPKILAELLSQAESFGIPIQVRQFSSDPYADLQAWMLEGKHVIVSFIPEDTYPIGTILTPVINVSSGSDFHKKFAPDFDVQSSESVERLIEELLGVFSRVRTFSEYTQTNIALMPLPLQVPDPAKEFPLVILNKALESLARDVAKHFESVDFLGWIGDWSEISSSTNPLIVLTTGSAFERTLLETVPPASHIFDLSEVGSLGALAEATSRFISTQK